MYIYIYIRYSEVKIHYLKYIIPKISRKDILNQHQISQFKLAYCK